MSNFARGLGAVLTAGILALAPVAASAMGSGSDSSGGGSSAAKTAPKQNAAYDKGVAAVEAQNWAVAIESLTVATEQDPKNADAFNYLGYAQRKSGDYFNALSSYRKALEIDPEHKGAHEYIGQAYLEIGNVAKAEEHLESLDSICTFGCAEYTSLKEAVARIKGS